ncbi:hypothetical protein AB0L71_07820 [Streptomyces sp. NPDC052052]|uniref:hypothetical protein n=1 Tax=Streptomyces sp. NPDC052052 TaxID=3154756 RepID=UPI003436D38B
MVQKPESDIEPKERRIDLSVPQVAGSAVAAVTAAVAASQLGVYGTILGAGVMSVVATCGGSVFQHVFRRTGEQIREVTVQVKHPDREVTVQTRETRRVRGATTAHDETDVTTVPDGTDATAVLPSVADDPDRTRVLTQLGGTHGPAAGGPGSDEEFSAATTHGTRMRGWKRPAVGAAVVFAVTMAGITTYELVSGNDLSGGKGTTIGSVVRGGERSSGSDDPAPATSTDPDQGRTPGQETPATSGDDSQGGQSRNPGDSSTADPTPSTGASDGTGGGASPAPTTSTAPAVPGDGFTADPDPTATGDVQGQDGGATTGTAGQ